MDTVLARTFLKIVETGSFVRAAERLHVSQTTVSARVKNLEEQLGRPLFVRNKAGAVLTAAGERFLRTAPGIVQLWERARQQVAVPPGHREVLSIGSEVALSRTMLLDWTIWMRRNLPDVALRVHVDAAPELLPQVADGLVDIGILYAPPARPGLVVDMLVEQKLVLVTTDPTRRPPDDPGYVHVDWGPEFARQHETAFPDGVAPGLTVGLGPLALDYILSEGGSGYFRKHVVQRLIEAGRLHLVPGAPQFAYPIYAVYAAEAETPTLQQALDGLRAIAQLPAGKVWWDTPSQA
ncbi:MAG: LysR family transcriptional regulator [Bauldia sp.]